MNGKLVEWKDATIHIASHVIHYGSGVFEGARCYATPKGSACFRLDEHMQPPAALREDLPDGVSARSRRLAERGPRHHPRQRDEGVLHPPARLSRLRHRSASTRSTNPVDAAIMLWEWGAYLGKEALEQGVRHEGQQSWSRMAPNTLPAMAKSTANYAELGADQDGSARRRLLRRHRARRLRQRQRRQRPEHLHRPRRRASTRRRSRSSILGGITRDSIITLARDLGYTVTETGLPREALYVADEVFVVGTAAEVTPIRSVDKITIGSGRRGPVTEALQRAFFDVINGDVPDTHGWLTYVYPEEASLRRRRAGLARAAADQAIGTPAIACMSTIS